MLWTKRMRWGATFSLSQEKRLSLPTADRNKHNRSNTTKRSASHEGAGSIRDHGIDMTPEQSSNPSREKVRE